MREAILLLRDNLPRTFVNVLPPFHVEILLQTQADNAFCVDLQRAFCPCLFELSKEEYDAVKQQFDAGLSEFLTAEYQTKNFAVTISPGFNVEQLPTVGNFPNIALLALDCFHFSPIAHDLVAKVIWRDLFTPVGSRTAVDLNQFQPQQWTCPPEDCPYLRTAVNSQSCGDAGDSLLDVLSRRWVKYENAVYLPSMSELDRRAFMEEHGTVLILSVLGIAILIAIICLAVAFSCKNTDLYPWEPNERTGLLNGKQLV
ncbi:Tat pathway signal sequence domain protein [Oesophagostomum dentatum]|uniref:Tat pathway signal sequence domain protein n=1 Tax=Oesophagostomum dentatum TaxID=61180 RepID=A0A0B1RXV2_OESDE|nr:Tat pathway signal sequence domain protein [Oesophagostomum dentatum]